VLSEDHALHREAKGESAKENPWNLQSQPLAVA
jgi:hypothetical protein